MTSRSRSQIRKASPSARHPEVDGVSERFGLRRRHFLVLAVISVEILFLLWFFPYLPMTDLPEHMMIAQIIVGYDDANNYGDFYTTRFIWNPYSTYFWFTGLIGPVVGVIGATKLYLSLALMLTLFAFVVWIRTVAPGKEPQIIPASLLLFGTFFYVGRINFLFSIPFLFLALALGWRVGKGWAVGRNTLWLGLILLVVYFSHIVTFALTMLFLGSQWFVFHRRNSFVELAVASAPALGFAVAYALSQASSEVAGFGVAYEPLGIRLGLLLMPLGVFRDVAGSWVYQWEAVTIWFGVLATFAVGAIRERKWRFRTEPLILVGLMLTAALVLPSNISDQALPIAMSASYPAAFAALALVSVAWDRQRACRIVVVLLCTLAPVALGFRMWNFQGEMEQMQAVIAEIPAGQVIQPVITEPHSPWFRTYPHLHASAWYTLLKGGTSPYLFVNQGHFPVSRKAPLEGARPGEWQMGQFNYNIHQQGTDYFLAKTRRSDILDDLASNVPLVIRAGDWAVYGPNPSSLW